MPQTDLQIKIKQVLEGGNQLKELRKNVTDLKATLFTLEQQGQKNTAQYKQFENALVSANGKLRAHTSEMKNLTGASKSSGAGMMKFAGQIGEVITGINQGIEVVKKFVGVIIDLGQQLFKIAEEGATFNILKENFDDAFGKDSENILKQFGTALAGNFNDEKIIKLANSFKLLGASNSEITQILDMAEDLSDVTGQPIEESTERLKSFFTSGKDNALAKALNISKSELEQVAATIGNTTVKNLKNLDNETKANLLLKAAIQLRGKSVEEILKKDKDAADQIAFLKTQYENLEKSVKSFISKGLEPVVKAIQKVIDKFGEIKDEIENTIHKNTALENSLKIVGKAMITFAKANLTAITEFINANIQIISFAAKTISGIVSVTVEGLKILAEATLAFINFSNSINPLFQIPTSGVEAFLQKIENFKIPKSNDAELVRTADGFNSDDNKGGDNKKDKKDKEKKKDLTHLEELKKKLEEEQKVLDEIEIDAGKGTAQWIAQKKVVDELTVAINTYGLKLKELGDASLEKTIQEIGGNKKFLPTETQKEVDRISQGFGITQDPEEVEKKAKMSLIELSNSILGIGNQFISILGIGADTFAAKLINGLQSGISLVTSIVDLVGKIADGISTSAQGADGKGGGVSGILGGLLSLIPGIGPILGGVVGFLGSLFGFAEGGYVSGKGTGTSDSIPARLSNGEYVVNAKSTSKYLPLLEMLNNGGQSKGYAFATGGLVRTGSNAGTTILISSDAAAFIKTTKMANNRIQQTNKWKRF